MTALIWFIFRIGICRLLSQLQLRATVVKDSSATGYNGKGELILVLILLK